MQKNRLRVNDADRFATIGLNPPDKKYDIIHFSGVTAEELQAAINADYADPNEQQNDAPPIGEILTFLKANPDFTCHGYVVTTERSDCRISVEGVACDHRPDQEQMDAFVSTFHRADQFSINPPRAWYD